MALAELSAREAFVNRGLRKLAADPNVRAMDLEGVARDLPRWAAGVLDAPRALIQWEEADEPWVHVAMWENRQWRYAREAPSVDTIAPDLAGADFMCQGRAHRVLRACHGRSSWWHGDPLGAAFRERHAVESVLSARFDGETAHGRVFIFDKPSMVVDDLVLAGLVARQVGNRLNQWYLLQRLTERVAGEERVRLGRDLHDGALHVLAGIALELEGILRVPNSESDEPDARLRELQASLVAEQRTLRILVERLRASGPLTIPGGLLLSVRLKDLVERLERRWPLRVQCDADRVDELPQALADEVYLMVHEALVNTARHADARTAAVCVRLQTPFVRIAVSDDGRGFPFRGTYSGTTLSALGVGPTTLKERTAALGGDLVLESTEHGSRIDICLPVREQ
jgi:signal transduction histidine kinase